MWLVDTRTDMMFSKVSRCLAHFFLIGLLFFFFGIYIF